MECNQIEYIYHNNVADKFDKEWYVLYNGGIHNDKEKLFSVLLFSTLLLADFLSIFYSLAIKCYWYYGLCGKVSQ